MWAQPGRKKQPPGSKEDVRQPVTSGSSLCFPTSHPGLQSPTRIRARLGVKAAGPARGGGGADGQQAAVCRQQRSAQLIDAIGSVSPYG